MLWYLWASRRICSLNRAIEFLLRDSEWNDIYICNAHSFVANSMQSQTDFIIKTTKKYSDNWTLYQTWKYLSAFISCLKVKRGQNWQTLLWILQVNNETNWLKAIEFWLWTTDSHNLADCIPRYFAKKISSARPSLYWRMVGVEERFHT
jgi:hypothetical protein